MSDKSKITSTAEYSALGFYHKITFLRSDTWIRLNRLAVRLKEKEAAGADTEQLRDDVKQAMMTLEFIEDYTAFPSKEDFRLLWRLLDDKEYLTLSRAVNRISRALSSDVYRNRPITMSRGQIEGNERDEEQEVLELHLDTALSQTRPYFELLVVDDLSQKEENVIRSSFRSVQRPEDPFTYDVIVVPSFQDAIAAVLINPNIQACILRSGFRYESKRELLVLKRYIEEIGTIDVDNVTSTDLSLTLGRVIGHLRPELDLYLITNMAVETYAAQSNECFRRIFYRETDYVERHLNIIRGINRRFDTPFFSALKRYSRQPTGVFHAMPISRAKSLMCSHWIRDMLEFYGLNVFLAETSTTSGGLDSLSQPSGPLKLAQEYAARAFGARNTFFVTNGTSTANKIVVQALIKPGDIVLVDRDCHKSHHYGMVLSGADVAYLDAYPIDQFSMYGGVPLKHIKKQLLRYKRSGKLSRVKMLLLTNCTFDGVVYDVERVMEECLAIKPDLVFLWDEAWFAFAAFHPIYRQRTAMCAAQSLRRKFRSAEYRSLYQEYLERTKSLDPDDIDAWTGIRMMPDPDTARVRAYATQSTHKTLTSLRQGSMIHVFDQDYRKNVQTSFHEAYMTHTSTSPNYQILASLDLGRRQVELEGYELVNKQLETAFALREQINSHPMLKKHMRVLTNADLVPAEYRPSGVETYFDDDTGWSRMEDAWLYSKDEFVIDPTRITLYIGETGIDGDTFKNQHLMDKYGIQINKTSRNTVLFMTNIGTTRSSIAYLIEALLSIARELEWQQEELSPPERRLLNRKIKSLTQELPPLPHFSRFHDAFRPDAAGDTPEGDMRTAFFMGDDDDLCEHIRIDNGAMQKLMQGGREMVSKTFIIPYPPGFPILVPGQVISEEILEFMLKLDVKEIHGYRPELGLAVFTEGALKAADDYGNESFPTKEVVEGEEGAAAVTPAATGEVKTGAEVRRSPRRSGAAAAGSGAKKPVKPKAR